MVRKTTERDDGHIVVSTDDRAKDCLAIEIGLEGQVLTKSENFDEKFTKMILTFLYIFAIQRVNMARSVA